MLSASTRRGRGIGDAGSSLILMPVALLIVLLLGAVAVDLAAVQLAHADLVDVAASAANDAVTAALDPDAVRASGAVDFDLRRAQVALDRSLEIHGLAQIVSFRSITVGPDPDQLTVELERPVRYHFARAINTDQRGTTIHARATARVRRR